MKYRWILIFIIAISFGFHLWGIRRDLPFAPDVDEPIFVDRAVGMAASGDPNPGWFGNPGSTVMYPLATFYHIWHAATHDGALFRPDPGLQARFDSNPGEFYVLGRFLVIAYAVMSVPLVYQVGRQSFGIHVGLIGAWFWVLSPLAVSHAKIVRTDSAAVFFGMLGLWLCLRLYQSPTIRNQIIAGLVIGLCISTRYFMVALIPVLLAIDIFILCQPTCQPPNLKATCLGISAGLLAILVAFALSTPYFFLDFATVSENLKFEARSTNPGADGLSPAQNFWWYLTRAMPQSLAWPQTGLAIVGVVLAVWSRRLEQILLVGFAVVFLVGISLSPLHWQRWIIQILPLLKLFAANTLVTGVDYLSRRLKFSLLAQRALIALPILLISARPVYQLVMLDVRHARPSTRLLAREWILQNLPPGSRIVQEAYSAPLNDTHFELQEYWSLAASGYTLDDAYRYGFRYIVASGDIYRRYMAEPDRYPTEIAFYQGLFAEGRLLQEFVPSSTTGGPVIRIYELPQTEK